MTCRLPQWLPTSVTAGVTAPRRSPNQKSGRRGHGCSVRLPRRKKLTLLVCRRREQCLPGIVAMRMKVQLQKLPGKLCFHLEFTIEAADGNPAEGTGLLRAPAWLRPHRPGFAQSGDREITAGR